MTTHKNLLTLCVAALLTFGLAACGSDGGDDMVVTPDPTPPPTPDPDPADVERQAISDAIAAAMTAVNAVNDASTDEMVEAAQMLVDAAMTAIDDASHISAGDVATYRARLSTVSDNLTAAMNSRTMVMNLANQRQAISETIAAAMAAVGAVNDDSDAATVTAAEDAIAAANAAIDDAADIPASEAATARSRVAAIYDDLSDAKTSRQAAIDAAAEAERMAREAEQRRTMQLAAITSAINMANTAVAAVNDTADDATVAAADAAVTAARTAIANAADVSEADLAGHTAMVNGLSQSLNTAKTSRQMAMDASRELASQRTAISDAIGMARTAVDAVNDDSTDAQVEAADMAVANARVAIAGAARVPDAEKAAHTGTVDALVAQLASAKTSHQVAMSAAAEAQRMANIAAAQAVLTSAQNALAALADDATDEEKRDAQRAVETAANTLRDVLQMNGGTASEIEAAIRTAQTAKVAADNLQDAITAAADAEAARQLAAINTAQTALSDAEDALAALADDATDKERRDALRAVERAAANLVQVLEDNGGTADQIMTATTRQNDAKMLADNLTTPIVIADQRQAIRDALDTLKDAVTAVDDDATDAEVKAADDAVAAARKAIEDATDLPDAETAANTGEVNAYAGILDTAKTSRMAAIDEEQRKANEAMAATAAKLYAGIGAQTVVGTANTVAAGTPLTNATDRAAAYNDAGQPTAGTTADTRIMVGIGTAAVVALTEDDETTVPANHGWEGKRYTHTVPADAATGAGDTYEAIVYSYVEAPTMGKMFGHAGAANDDFEYGLTNGALAIDTTAAATPESRVGGSSFDHTAGVKTFDLPSPNPTLQTVVAIPGSFHGVSGTYTCTPGAGNTCGARVAADGFELGLVADADGAFTDGSGTWMFRPGNPNARVMDVEDDEYASYGWWLYKSADGQTFTASAFVDELGTVPGATGIDTLRGTATYTGGAAGKYALSSSTGGTNDAGHFTARATLEADFNDDEITGTIDNFMGADDQPRDWSVKLNEAGVTATGGIVGTANGLAIAADNPNVGTVWTIGGTDADAAGQWSGTLFDTANTDTDTSGVPKVGTGTFYSTYGTAGRMVGGFGVTKQ